MQGIKAESARLVSTAEQLPASAISMVPNVAGRGSVERSGTTTLWSCVRTSTARSGDTASAGSGNIAARIRTALPLCTKTSFRVSAHGFALLAEGSARCYEAFAV
jgi:hypothetical protein